MEPQSVDITKLSLTELKAHGFDTQNQIAFHQSNLQTIARELERRAAPAVVEAPAEAA